MNAVTEKTTYPHKKNIVLDESYRTSSNFYNSDKILRNYLGNNISKEGQSYMENKLSTLGKEAAGKMNELSLLADKHGPVLEKRNFLGDTINEIRFHPAYWELMEVAVKSEMFRIKWEPSLRKKFKKEGHQLGFSAGYLYAMSECGQFCPLCMTDGVARLIDIYCDEKDKARLLPHIYTQSAGDFFTGAMFLTEKTGGSDVGANIAVASPFPALPSEGAGGGLFYLSGEKWFCSNANADLIFSLARTDNTIRGTKGLSIFLVEKHLPDGSRNPIDVIRIKEKLGVRSMATAECMHENTIGKMVGKEFEGFKVMVEMINLSRLYNSVGAISCSRRALIETFQFLNHRQTFRKPAIEHALIRTKLTELGALNVANFYLTWRTIRSLDQADSGNERESHLFRIINPMTKKWTAETGVYITRECMELMGGMGYIEDGVMPKVMRDVMVLPIWEGSGNIIILDMLRAMVKSNGFKIICEEILKVNTPGNDDKTWLSAELEKLILFSEKLLKLPQDEMEASAKIFFEKLTSLFQISLLFDNLNDESKAWILPSVDFLKEKYKPSGELNEVKPLSVAKVKGLIGWDF